ncbi:hypothetical protein ACYT6H_09110, partial [Streptococcus pyogenes]
VWAQVVVVEHGERPLDGFPWTFAITTTADANRPAPAGSKYNDNVFYREFSILQGIEQGRVAR